MLYFGSLTTTVVYPTTDLKPCHFAKWLRANPTSFSSSIDVVSTFQITMETPNTTLLKYRCCSNLQKHYGRTNDVRKSQGSTSDIFCQNRERKPFSFRRSLLTCNWNCSKFNCNKLDFFAIWSVAISSKCYNSTTKMTIKQVTAREGSPVVQSNMIKHSKFGLNMIKFDQDRSNIIKIYFSQIWSNLSQT